MEQYFTRFAATVSDYAGRPGTFTAALAIIILWAASGPVFGFSETWQLIVNTATTIITFLMVFILQNSQNRDGRALQAKLDELILTSRAENRFMGIENLDSKELEHLTELLHKAAARGDDRCLREEAELLDKKVEAKNAR